MRTLLLLLLLLPCAACVAAESNAVSATTSLENTCQCDCCYEVGANGRTDCVSPIATSFDVQSCAECDVDACSAMFPITCAQASSIVNSNCIVRKGWVLEFVPLFFLSISVLLLAYGFYKRFDGYHDVSSSAPDAARPILNDALLGYESMSLPYRTSSMRHARSPSSEAVTAATRLPNIAEGEQLSSDDSVALPMAAKSSTTTLDPIPEFAPLGGEAVQHGAQSSSQTPP